MINLLLTDGEIISVDEDSCYSPDENGIITCATGGFGYVRGTKTDEKPTHKIRDDDLAYSLKYRGDIVPINE